MYVRWSNEIPVRTTLEHNQTMAVPSVQHRHQRIARHTRLLPGLLAEIYNTTCLRQIYLRIIHKFTMKLVSRCNISTITV